MVQRYAWVQHIHQKCECTCYKSASDSGLINVSQRQHWATHNVESKQRSNRNLRECQGHKTRGNMCAFASAWVCVCLRHWICERVCMPGWDTCTYDMRVCVREFEWVRSFVVVYHFRERFDVEEECHNEWRGTRDERGNVGRLELCVNLKKPHVRRTRTFTPTFINVFERLHWYINRRSLTHSETYFHTSLYMLTNKLTSSYSHTHAYNNNNYACRQHTQQTATHTHTVTITTIQATHTIHTHTHCWPLTWMAATIRLVTLRSKCALGPTYCRVLS